MRVLVTGFGSFGSISVNASGEAVKVINREELQSRLNITLKIINDVPVLYEYIDKEYRDEWEDFKPHLTIHVGMDDTTDVFKIEKHARKSVYGYTDDVDAIPVDNANPCNGDENITTDLPVDVILEKFSCKIPAVLSEEAGLFLCEYIYYTTLSLCQQMEQDKNTIFIHVPMKTEEEEFQELARGLENLIEICVDTMRCQEDTL